MACLTGNGGDAVELPARALAQLDASSSFAGNGGPIHVIGGTVTQSATWQAHDADVRVSASVAIEGYPGDPIVAVEPGARFTLGPEAGLTVGVGEDGGLVAVGTAEAPIVFTSDALAPVAGDWLGLHLADRCLVADLEQVVVEYGGANEFGNVWFQGCDGAMVDSTTASSSTYEIYRDSSSAFLSGVTYVGNAFDLF